MKSHAALIVITALVGARAMADDPMKFMQKRAAEFDHAMLTKDLAWFEKYAASNFVEFEVNGKSVSRSSSLAEVKQSFAMMTTTQISTQVLDAREKGGAITGTLRTVMTAKVPPPNKSAKGIAKDDMTYSERWVKEGAVWKLQWLKTLKEKTTIDGKPVPGG